MLDVETRVHRDDPADRPTLVIDKFLHPKLFLDVIAELHRMKGWNIEYDEYDRTNAMPTGMTCEIADDSIIHHAMYDELEKLFSKPWKLYRFFVNKFQPNERPKFHTDGNAITCLLYANNEEVDFNEHGETQLLVNGEVRGVLPVPNRLLVFDGRLMHRATSFRTRVRYTISLHLDHVSFADIRLPGSEAPARLS